MTIAVVAALAIGCGSSSTALDPDIDAFDVDPADRADIDDAAANGDGAEGTYTYDEGTDTLSLTITASTFACGIETGVIEATVVELTATTMVWEFGGSDGGVTWTRVDNSEAVTVVGIWHTDEPSLFLVLSADGIVQVFGEGEVCDEDRPRNDNSCVELGLTGVDIAIDGDLGEWSSVAESATVHDDAGDQVGDDVGADLRAMKVEFGGSSVFVLMQLYGAPSTSFQAREPPNSGTYRLTIWGDNGLSLTESIAYSPEAEAWMTLGYASEITAATGADGVEWEIDVSAYVGEGFDSVDLIMIEPIDCGVGSCEPLDYTDCGYFAVPK